MRRMTKAAVSQERAEGRGPAYIKTGRQVRYRVADVVAFIEAHRVVPGSDDHTAPATSPTPPTTPPTNPTTTRWTGPGDPDRHEVA